MGHYYTWRNGEVIPFYDVPKKDGSGLRPVTIRDARNEKAVPSVNEILSIQANPMLTEWLCREALQFGWDKRGESGDGNEGQVSKHLTFEDCQSLWSDEREKAADRGSELHDLVWEQGIRDGKILEDQVAKRIVDSILALGYKNFEVEKCFASRRLGYGGRVDGIAQHDDYGNVVLDLKTITKKRNPYDKEYSQVAGYKRLLNEEYNRDIRDAHLIYVVRESGEVCAVSKLGALQQEALEKLDACFGLWKADKHYDPCAA